MRKFRDNDEEDNDNDELLESPTVRTNPKDFRTNEYEVVVEVSDDSPLTTDKRETLRYEMSMYKEENQRFEKNLKALNAIRKEIQQTITRGARDITYHELHPYFIMVKLMEIYAPLDTMRETDLKD
jgi:CII-binding regulator of phage lambda lysogenization HflD